MTWRKVRFQAHSAKVIDPANFLFTRRIEMKRLTQTTLTLTLVTILSSTAFAGHIAGGRAAGHIAGGRASGHIAGGRASGHIAGGRAATIANPSSLTIVTNETTSNFDSLHGSFASLIRMLFGAGNLF